MHAVRCVDLQALTACAVINHFVDVGGAEVLTRITKLRRTPGGTDGGVAHLEVHRLIFFVRIVSEENRS